MALTKMYLKNPEVGGLTVTERFKSIKADLDTVESTINSQIDGINDIDKRLSTAQSDIDTNQTAIAALKSNVTDNAEGVSTNANSIIEMSSALSLIISDISANQTAIATLKSNVADNAEGVSTNANSIVEMSSALSTMISNIDANQTAIVTLKSDVADNASTITELNDSINALETDKADLQNSSGGFEGGSETTAGIGAAVGYKANANSGFAGGREAMAYNGGAAGLKATASYGFAGGSEAWTYHGGAVGGGAVSQNGFSGGHNAKVKNNGTEDEPNYINAVQLGEGTNSDAYSMQLYDYKVVSSTSERSDSTKYLTDVGLLSELDTDEKGSIVQAVNEVKAETAALSKRSIVMPQIIPESYTSGVIANIGSVEYNREYLYHNDTDSGVDTFSGSEKWLVYTDDDSANTIPAGASAIIMFTDTVDDKSLGTLIATAHLLDDADNVLVYRGDDIGAMADLETRDKSTIVGAINELLARIAALENS